VAEAKAKEGVGQRMSLKRSMAPVGATDARLLILGSLPGEASLAAQRYYAHPTNQFWRLLGAAIGEDLAGLDYAARLERLAERRIALWDVVAEARRRGSLDGAIRAASPNELAQYVASHTRLEAVAFNGKTSAAIGRRALKHRGDLTFIDLPSSSAALTRPLGDKAAAWAALGRYAGVARQAEKSKLPA
jgi:hypoxanthine-DNA glycosylase